MLRAPCHDVQNLFEVERFRDVVIGVNLRRPGSRVFRAVMVATIPHIVGVLLLPPWLVILLAAASMLIDQLVGRAAVPKVVFNVSSVALTVGLAAFLAGSVGLERQSLGQPGEWLQVPAFLFVAATYYAVT